MHELCHRCHGELPLAAAGNKQSSDDALLFCPRCSAPQILLPEHMREMPAESTTGTTPPPRPGLPMPDPRQVDWRVALTAAGVIALVGAALRLAGLKFEVISIVWFFWMLAGANLALAVYERKRPGARMDARVGMRIGLVTGMLMCAAMAVAGGAAGVVQRFGLHAMANFDAESEKQRVEGQQAVQVWMKDHDFDPELQKNTETMNATLGKSPEVLAGFALGGFGFEAFILILISAGIGGMNGLVRGARLSRQRREP